MDIGKLATCAHCGKQFKMLLENHDEMSCIAGLREENARLTTKLTAAGAWGADRAAVCEDRERLIRKVDELERESKLNRAAAEKHYAYTDRRQRRQCRVCKADRQRAARAALAPEVK